MTSPGLDARFAIVVGVIAGAGVDSCSHNIIDGDDGCIVCGSKTAKKSGSAKIRPHFHAAFLTNAAPGNRGARDPSQERGV